MSFRTLSGPVFAASIALVSLAGCASQTGPGENVDATEDELRTTYGNILETLPEAQLEQWIAARSALATGFDQICGDTICSGDFSNLTTVRIACSSTKATQKLKACTWVLGGSIDRVDSRTGKIITDARVFTCNIPVASSAKSMLDTLRAAGAGALQAPLPGTGQSFYDGLVSCFSGVSGVAVPEQPKTFYGELGDFEWTVSEAAGLAYLQGLRKLAQGFDDVCGDTFCEGDYSDITPLRLACSVNQSTKRVARCSWSFAAAELSVDSKGAVTARTAVKKCVVEVGSSATDFSALLSGDDPLNTKLPGRKTSIYDALVGCL